LTHLETVYPALQINTGPAHRVQRVDLKQNIARHALLLAVNVKLVRAALYLLQTSRAFVPLEPTLTELLRSVLHAVQTVKLARPLAALNVKQTLLFKTGHAPVEAQLTPLETVQLALQINTGPVLNVHHVHLKLSSALNAHLLPVNVKLVQVHMCWLQTLRAFVPRAHTLMELLVQTLRLALIRSTTMGKTTALLVVKTAFLVRM
jgi:hypothetical protein